MKINRALSSLFFIVIIVYFSQGFLYTSGSILSRVTLLIWLLVGLGYAVRYILSSQYRNNIGNIIFIFWLINTIYWIISPHIVYMAGRYPISTMVQYKNITTVFLSYYPIYIWIRKGIINEKYFYWLSFFLFMIMVANFLFYGKSIAIKLGEEEITNNIAYNFVLLLLLLSMFSNKKIFYVFFFLSFYFILKGAKRGAIVCLVFECLIFIYYKYKSTSINKRLFAFFGVLVLLAGLGIIGNYIYESSEYLQYRMEQTIEGDMSNRDIIYKDAYRSWMVGNVFQLCFGYGFAQSVDVMGIYAHNDWLELLVCNGLLGVFLYLLIFVSLVVFYVKNKHCLLLKYKMVFMMLISVWSVRSMVSMGYTDQFMFIVMMVIAILQNQISIKEYKRL